MRHLHYRPAWLAIGWLLVLFVGYMSLSPSPPTLDVRYFDKAGHFLAYFTLMCWFSFIYLRRVHTRVALMLVALGVVLETVQWYTGYREFSIGDIAANTAGVATGWMIAGTRFAALLEGIERRIGAH